ncbi:MAG TPA: SpoIIE family protein phosphatase [Gaiellaceae bacterium]|nr:SpoIIE family protein phosphatase [Gaiellaceae bacterium]
MTSREENTRRPQAPIRAPKSALVRYLVAVVSSAAGIAIATVIVESPASEQPLYAPLIGAAAITSWYGGFGPSALAIVLCWTSALFVLEEPRGALGFGESDGMVRWSVNLAFAVLIAWIGGVIRVREERSAVAADSARSDIREIESLQELMIALTGALSSSDVARAVSLHSGRILSASGVALGLVDGDELAIVDPTGLGAEARPDGARLQLQAEMPITEAARTGSMAIAESRADLERAYPESDANLPALVEGALALPLRAEGGVIGSVEFLFERDTPLDADTVALGRIVVDLAAQTLERARLYESEQESRLALDRILEVAPRFLAEDTDDVVRVICSEARSTFGADYAVLWRIHEETLELLAIDPPHPQLLEAHLQLADFPRLRQAIEGLTTSFVPDVLESTYGAGNEFVRQLGIRSSLRAPVLISGASELVLSISWQAVVSEPDQATTAVVRRFADQAALALEQAERRRAEAEAARRADATRRLQEVTAELSVASTTLDVSTTCLEKALDSVGAEAGFVVLTGPAGSRAVELVTSAGYGDEELAAWRALDLDANAPFARAVSSGEAVWALSSDELSDFADANEPAAKGWIAVPLTTRGGVRGALHLSLHSRRTFTDEERAWLQSMVSQCGQALERASQYEAEQTIAETLQRSVLPSSLPRVDGVQLAARYLPGSAQLDVGGDWFDALQLPDGKLGLIVGDVVGKGVQAAASMAQLRNAIRAFSVERLKPSSVLMRLNRLADEVLDTSFATLAYIALDPETGTCRFASAGHPPPAVAYPDGRVDLLEDGRGLPLGTGVRKSYRQETFELPAGSVVVLYTDGLVERRGRSIDEGLEALRTALVDAPKDPDRLLEHILEHVVGTDERGDDIALLAARLLPVAPRPLELRVAANVRSMDLVRDAMRAWLRGVELRRPEVEDVVLATWEACANAIEHAVDPTDQLVDVRAWLADSSVHVTVSDTGSWAPPSERDGRGLGLRLMASLVSSMEIDEHEDGTTVTLEKALSASAD